MAIRLVVQEVKGLKELDAFLQNLPEDMQRNILFSTLMTAAEPIMKQARSNVARNFGMSMRYTGTLYRGIVRGRRKRTGLAARVDVKLRRVSKQGQTTKGGPMGNAVTKPYGDDPFYGRFLEFGWRTRSGTTVPAKPFLRPAADSRQGEAGTKFRTATARKLGAWAKKNGFKFTP